MPQFSSDDVRALCQQGYEAYDAEDYRAALRLFYQAWLQLPKPQTQLPDAGWVLTAIGDTYFRLNQYPQAIEALQSALCCESLDQNPFTLMRLGQCFHEVGQKTQARKYLFNAYKGSAGQIFSSENAIYLQNITDLIGAEQHP